MSTRFRRMFAAVAFTLSAAVASAISGCTLPADDAADDELAAKSEEIVGGTTARRGEFPFMVMLGDGGLCGGSLVAPRWVLTAAHCAEYVDRAYVGLYSWSNPAGSRSIPIVQKVIHPLRHTGTYDFALMKLSEPAGFPPIRIGLPSDVHPRTDSMVLGWGRTSENGSHSDILKKANLPIVSQDICRSTFGELADASVFCAGVAAGGRDSCNGDSGGPVIIKKNNVPYQLGVVSFGHAGCARPNQPGGYGNVTAVRTWLTRYIGALN